MIQPGVYTATVANHAITETQKGDPQAVVTFAFSTDIGPQQISWYGYFTEKTTAKTIESLIICGLKGNNPAGDLEIGRQVSIVIEHETDEKGKARAKVRWVNQLGASRNAMPPDLAKSKLSVLEGAVMAARQNLNIPSDDIIPF